MPYDLNSRDDKLLQVGLLCVVFTVAVACHLTACLLLGGAFPGFEQSLSPVQRMCPVPDKNTAIPQILITTVPFLYSHNMHPAG